MFLRKLNTEDSEIKATGSASSYDNSEFGRL